MKKIFINILRSIKEDDLLKSMFLAGIIYNYCFIAIQVMIFSTLNSRIMSIGKAVTAVGTFIISLKWKDFVDDKNKDPEDIVKKYYPYLLKAEFVVYPALIVLYLFTRNIIVFYSIDTIATIVLTTNASFCFEYLLCRKYSGKALADFRVNVKTVTCITSTTGMILATLIPPSVEVALICLFISNTIDNRYLNKVYEEVYLDNEKKEIN